MESNLDMGGKLIENVGTPKNADHGVNKSYVDIIFLNLKGGLLQGPLSMGRYDLIGLPDQPKFRYNAINKNYLENQLNMKLDKTIQEDLDMDGHKIKNVGTPSTSEDNNTTNLLYVKTQLSALTDQYKQYVDHSHLSPSGSQKDVFRYLMSDVNESSSESNITVQGIGDYTSSPHIINKKAHKVTLVKDNDGSNDFRSRLGFNLYQLPLAIGLYTMIVEFYPP